MFNNMIVCIVAYLLGSIPWALVIGKVFYHTDIRNQGSGNLGGTNAGRVLGKKAGVTVIVLDALKAVPAMLLSYYFAPEVLILSGLACCLGHCFPIFAQFKGGKAVATGFGFLLGICLFHKGEYLGLFATPLAIFLITLYLSKMVSLSSLVALFSAGVMSILLKEPISIQLPLFVLWLFVAYRHKENIKRIRNRTESKISWL
ncbi:glycerol-3-phosphate 1-O-acyltransferase PlsY [Bulleidia sp. zg-1006]|uniref:glycerol-3-phosphate 1-O-acyltransferase PlsY n=1 Tax=Bulleidia sp. zg-1006 TaxID=2806552 RepID=UPI00193A0095|nr:glycerol-3-phosphate 1-O-acyltransferase PlsY [Bulleidia sp. zg-1006]QRG87099.1 glycerol-3-phosphate 1-O-acyltransferase PlsY [Bulleidia sp. zg-1006]